MSLTSPITTLTLGQNAPMPNRSSATPPSTLPPRSSPAPLCFFGAVFGGGPITPLTIRSTRTLPLRVNVLDHRSDFLFSHHRAAVGSAG